MVFLYALLMHRNPINFATSTCMYRIVSQPDLVRMLLPRSEVVELSSVIYLC